MSDRIKVFAGLSNPGLAQAVCSNLGTELGFSESYRYYNGCSFVRIGENVREADVFIVQTAEVPINDYLVELLMLISAAKNASARRVTAVIPHFFYQQSDKKDEPRICITAKLVAQMLQAAGTDRVLTMDLHAPQIQAFFDCPVDQLTAVPIINEYFADLDIPNLVVVATDVGRANLVRKFARRLNAPLAIIDKHRLDEQHVEALHVIGDVAGKTALVLDDLIGTGGSLVEAARILKANGVGDVYAGAVHGVLAPGSVDRLAGGEFAKVIVTDTLPVEPKIAGHDTFKVLSVAPLLAQAIRNIHEGASVSAIFK